jgi:hypothetical protein
MAEEYEEEPEENDELPGVSYRKASLFGSKTTDIAQGKGTVKGKKKKPNLKRYMHPSKKPTAITKMIPKPVEVARQEAARNIIGVPAGVDGFRPIRFFESDNKPAEKDILFGGIKRDKSGKIKLF